MNVAAKPACRDPAWVLGVLLTRWACMTHTAWSLETFLQLCHHQAEAKSGISTKAWTIETISPGVVFCCIRLHFQNDFHTARPHRQSLISRAWQ